MWKEIFIICRVWIVCRWFLVVSCKACRFSFALWRFQTRRVEREPADNFDKTSPRVSVVPDIKIHEEVGVLCSSSSIIRVDTVSSPYVGARLHTKCSKQRSYLRQTPRSIQAHTQPIELVMISAVPDDFCINPVGFNEFTGVIASVVWQTCERGKPNVAEHGAVSASVGTLLSGRRKINYLSDISSVDDLLQRTEEC